MKSPSIAGQTFGKLTVLYETTPVPVKAGNRKPKMSRRWVCLCACGNKAAVQGRHLKARLRAITSCGCALGFEDLTGRRFGKWSVVERRGNDASRNARWLCRCDCGEERLVSSTKLRDESSQSCGCAARTQNGESTTPEYAAWNAAIRRCYNPDAENFADYGGRGITVSDEWRGSYSAFLAHIGRRPSRVHSLDRINNDGNYEAGNVRWATKKEQQGNRRSYKPRR